MRVIIVGGHGKVALRAARLLSQRGDEVTALIRNPDHAADVRAAGATPVRFDVEDATDADFGDAIAGHDAIVWSAGAGGGDPTRTDAVDRDAAIRSMRAASTAGVRRYVMVSYFGAGLDHGVPQDNSFYAYAEAKAAADEFLRHSELDWTILGPSRLTDRPGGGISVGAAGTAGRAESVSRDAVAAVIAAVLSDPTTIGRQLEFSDGADAVGLAW
ncbi:SDR family oxidoreductase [Gordonia defluvii]|uniref:SDR family oxidoreductase n=1 Tax=Gordonia defluvii TaxID=283718 RepID=A0ABP6L634_9ACTN|nr:NAD(P)H-binding protein [Gordonia sp. UBA5067]